jgi:hypothetical protein
MGGEGERLLPDQEIRDDEWSPSGEKSRGGEKKLQSEGMKDGDDEPLLSEETYGDHERASLSEEIKDSVGE